MHCFGTGRIKEVSISFYCSRCPYKLAYAAKVSCVIFLTPYFDSCQSAFLCIKHSPPEAFTIYLASTTFKGICRIYAEHTHMAHSKTRSLCTLSYIVFIYFLLK